MSHPLDVLPDAEQLVTTYLPAVPAIAALVDDRVTVEVPAVPIYPLIVARRFGGPQAVRGWLDAARIQLDCYGRTKTEAQLVAQTALAALLVMSRSTHTGAYVTGVRQASGPSWQPQGDKRQPMYVFDVVILVQPA